MLEYVQKWTNEHYIATNVLKYVFWVIVILLLVSLVRKFLKNKLPDNSIRYKSQKGVEVVGYTLIIFLSVSYFTGNIKDFTLAVGLLTAGITITLQELFLSIAGSFYIFFVKVYKPGDRIRHYHEFYFMARICTKFRKINLFIRSHVRVYNT